MYIYIYLYTLCISVLCSSAALPKLQKLFMPRLMSCFCSFEIAEQPAMHKLMQNNTALAQKLLAGIMKSVCSTRGTKRSADQALLDLQR